MSEFVFLFRADQTDQRKAMGTPEHAQESMRAWLEWIGVLKAKGHLKDPGQPLDTKGKVVRGANKLITDGPYVETKDLVLGYHHHRGAGPGSGHGAVAGVPDAGWEWIGGDPSRGQLPVLARGKGANP